MVIVHFSMSIKLEKYSKESEWGRVDSLIKDLNVNCKDCHTVECVVSISYKGWSKSNSKS